MLQHGLLRASFVPPAFLRSTGIVSAAVDKSLSAATEIITKAQHCCAEVYLREVGWVPVDPTDMRKVVLEDPPGNRPLDDDIRQKSPRAPFWVPGDELDGIQLRS